jgi:hypothetical protein
MSAPEKVLAVVWHKQKKYYYCGPATIQMILEYRGAGLIAQDSLWHDVQQNSACAWEGDVDELDAVDPTDNLWVSACPCWATSPEALKATINLHKPGAVSLQYKGPPLPAINALIASIDANAPAAVTIRGVNHWVVVNGYLMDPPAQPGPGQPDTIQGLYVTDPFQTDAIKRHKLVPLRQWKGAYFASMDCGVHQDEHPLVVGS